MDSNNENRRGITTAISALMPAPEGMIAAYKHQNGLVFSEIIALAAVSRTSGDQTWAEVVGVLGYRQGKMSFADDFGNFSHYANHLKDMPEGTKRLYNQQKLTTQTGNLQPRPARGTRG